MSNSAKYSGDTPVYPTVVAMFVVDAFTAVVGSELAIGVLHAPATYCTPASDASCVATLGRTAVSMRTIDTCS